MSVATLKKQLLDEVGAARALSAKVEAENRSFHETEAKEVKARMEKALEIKGQIKQQEEGEENLKALNVLGLEYGELAKSGGAAPAKGLTLGQKFTDSDAFQGFLKGLPGGKVSEKMAVNTPPVAFGGIKEILAGGDRVDGPGLLVNRDELGLIDNGRFIRPLTFRSLVTGGNTDGDTIHYVREGGYVNNAAPVPEARGVEPFVVGAGNVQGLKPQSDFTLTEETTTVKTIAHWIPATKRALSDASQLRTLIDSFLRVGLEEELEDQIVNGSGTGENFRGILQTSGRIIQPHDTDILVTSRKAKTRVRVNGRANPSAYVFNPEDNEKFDLLREGGTTGPFIFGGAAGNQVQTLWGLPRIESEAMPVGRGLVADFTKAILWDRHQATVAIAEQHADFFIRNMVAILAELSAAFGIIRPSAFVEIDLTVGV